MSIIRLARRED